MQISKVYPRHLDVFIRNLFLQKDMYSENKITLLYFKTCVNILDCNFYY